MQIVKKTACSYSYFLAQEQQAFVRHTLKLITGGSKLIPDVKSSKLDHSKHYTSSKIFHISLNYIYVIKMSLTYSIYTLISFPRFAKYSNP